MWQNHRHSLAVFEPHQWWLLSLIFIVRQMSQLWRGSRICCPVQFWKCWLYLNKEGRGKFEEKNVICLTRFRFQRSAYVAGARCTWNWTTAAGSIESPEYSYSNINLSLSVSRPFLRLFRAAPWPVLPCADRRNAHMEAVAPLPHHECCTICVEHSRWLCK